MVGGKNTSCWTTGSLRPQGAPQEIVLALAGGRKCLRPTIDLSPVSLVKPIAQDWPAASVCWNEPGTKRSARVSRPRSPSSRR